MSMFKKTISTVFVFTSLSMGFASLAQSQSTGLGTPISESQLATFDRIVGPDGSGLPSGSGSAVEGKLVYEAKCQACHGAEGEGISGNTRIVGGDMQSADNPIRTVGSFWPYATTIFDYVRRAMPADAPKSLTDTEVYQVTAYVLYMNGIINQSTVLNSETLAATEMPNREGFIDQSQVQ
jgi:cytochrome c